VKRNWLDYFSNEAGCHWLNGLQHCPA